MVCQSQFNRRARNLCWLLNRMRRDIVHQMGLLGTDYRLVDGTPVQNACSCAALAALRQQGQGTSPVGHLLLPEAALGHCAAKKETFSGYRLIVLTTIDGIPTDWGLIPANVDEREGALDIRTFSGIIRT